MYAGEQFITIDYFLADMRTYFTNTEPLLLALYDIYAAEAAFGRHFIASDLECLTPSAKILEVGSGSMLLSCQLIREGFQVTALEPLGSGFSHFEKMRQIISARANVLGCLPQSLNINAESLNETEAFDYAFSINVMEHVDSVSLVITKIAKCLKIGASYRFTSPNYLFPYEPHFNIPILFSKNITEKIFKQMIFCNKEIDDPLGLWRSLNWISVFQVRKIVQQIPGLRATFSRRYFVSTIARVASDQNFASRRSPVVRWILLILMKFQLHRLFRFIPAEFQPVIDCTLQKPPLQRSPDGSNN
jgi:2-polyprenyl-3-methyl-5-hydroxy-6-metoxy-1,4-benzoquinol methylase